MFINESHFEYWLSGKSTPEFAQHILYQNAGSKVFNEMESIVRQTIYNY